MLDTNITTVNPIEIMRTLYNVADDEEILNIEYDENLTKGDFNIIRTSTNDGTLCFIQELYYDTLAPVADGTCYNVKDEPEWDNVDHLEYIIGNITHITTFVNFDIGGRTIPAQKDSTNLPVKAIVVYK